MSLLDACPGPISDAAARTDAYVDFVIFAPERALFERFLVYLIVQIHLYATKSKCSFY